MARRGLAFSVVALLAGVILQGCAAPLPGDDLLAEKLSPRSSRPIPLSEPRGSTAIDASGAKFNGAYATGTDRFVGSPPDLPLPDAGGDDEITLNLLNLPIAQAARTVLGEVLELTYTIDGPGHRRCHLADDEAHLPPPAHERVPVGLRDKRRRHSRAVGRLSHRSDPGSDPHDRAGRDGRAGAAAAGVRSYIVPLTYVVRRGDRRRSPEPRACGRGLESRSPTQYPGAVGSDQEIATLKETIALFDVDWMRGIPSRSSRSRPRTPNRLPASSTPSSIRRAALARHGPASFPTSG